MTEWRKSSRSADENCLEARLRDGSVDIRDSKNPNVHITASLDAWAELVSWVRTDTLVREGWGA